MHRVVSILGLAIASAIMGPGRADAAIAVPSRAWVQGAVADDDVRARAEEVVAGQACAAQLRDELAKGRGDATTCDDARARLGRALVRRSHRRFGWVVRREVELSRVRWVLGRAVRCRTWPLRSGTRDVLERGDVEAAGCRLRRYEGPVAVTLVDARGGRLTLPPLSTDADGNLWLELADVDALVRSTGQGSLAGFERIELGHDGWAGAVDLRRLRAFRADWHARWVEEGRGVPDLFVVAHPDHPAADEVRALAVEARLQRQKRDYEAVVAGRMSVYEFLARHVWSPYRAAVEARAKAAITGTPSPSSR